LKKGEKFILDEKCQKALDNIKIYLTNTLILSSCDSKKIFLLYVSTTLNALREMLAQKDDNNKERTIYYISKTLLDYEIRYTLIEKMCFAIVLSNENLKHYMLENTTYFIAQGDSLRYLMSKSYLSGRVTKWVMLLQEFDLVFITQNFIKGQAIVYFITNHL